MKPNVYIYILVMAGVTYLIRMLPLALAKKEITNPFIKSFLFYVPYACLAAMTFPAILSATGEKEISQESECDDENTFCVSRQYLSQPHGRVRDEGFGQEDGAGVTILYRVCSNQPGGDWQPGLSSGTAQAGGA